MFGQYGNFLNDPTAQIAAQFGSTAFKQGQQYLENNVSAKISIRMDKILVVWVDDEVEGNRCECAEQWIASARRSKIFAKAWVSPVDVKSKDSATSRVLGSEHRREVVVAAVGLFGLRLGQKDRYGHRLLRRNLTVQNAIFEQRQSSGD